MSQPSDLSQPVDQYPTARLCTPTEALRTQTRSIVVAEDQEVSLSATHAQFADCFARIRIQNYQDAQLLGLLPRKLQAEKVRLAVLADDKEAYEISSKASFEVDCDCQPHSFASVSFQQSFRNRYNRIRQMHNPALSRLLSDHYQTQLSWDDPVAGIARKWFMAVESSVFAERPILALLTSDITIHKKASLLVDRATTALFAHDIYIHRTGKLVVGSSYLKIWSSSVRSFLFTSDAVFQVAKMTPVWLTDL